MQRAAHFMLEYEKMEQFWLLAIGGAVIMAGVASLGTSFAILPELKKAVKSQKKREFNTSDSFKELSEDDHGKIYRQKH
ncbi:hypothetical protein [Holdemanella biformis]|uniref:hypothetical protein n=1 Tax=Holdemanella biformis TaxID=1735 RepID=UPI0022E79954|nr:hypothetical protein [Holdemanella biformis]